MPKKVILFAPNVHIGGGFVLLKLLLSAWPAGQPLYAVLDARAQAALEMPENITVLQWVKPSVLARARAELVLRNASAEGDDVLCFHGLPPLLRNAARVVVFLQNRLYFGLTPLSIFSLRTALRLAVELRWSRYLRFRVTEYLVQTPTMKRDLIRWFTLGHPGAPRPQVSVLPFMAPVEPGNGGLETGDEWDFVYVSSGDAHKNHRRLIDAWCELAQQGIRPRLALTLNPLDDALLRHVDVMRAEFGVEIHNLGQLPHSQVLGLYRHAKALIFPSLTESFGLPLLEAQQLGLPILASELDYVRDVCEPVQTFDPQSAQSIARAVQRFLKLPEPQVAMHTATDVWGVLSQI